MNRFMTSGCIGCRKNTFPKCWPPENLLRQKCVAFWYKKKWAALPMRYNTPQKARKCWNGIITKTPKNCAPKVSLLKENLSPSEPNCKSLANTRYEPTSTCQKTPGTAFFKRRGHCPQHW